MGGRYGCPTRERIRIEPRAPRPEDRGAVARQVVVRCPACDTKNRVDPQRAATGSPRCAGCREHLELPSPQGSPLPVTDATFAAVVERSPVPVLLEFKSRTCPHSQRVRPLVERMARDVWDRLRVATLDIDENRVTAGRYRVSATPTFLVLDRGRELDRIEGAVSEDQLRYRLHRYLTI